MTSEERIAALEQELGQLRSDLANTIPRMEAQQYALTMFVAQVAALQPAPDLLFAHLPEDIEVSGLYSHMPDDMRDKTAVEMQRILRLLLDMRRGMAELELKRLPE